jgi:hypothetical protein
MVATTESSGEPADPHARLGRIPVPLAAVERSASNLVLDAPDELLLAHVADGACTASRVGLQKSENQKDRRPSGQRRFQLNRP